MSFDLDVGSVSPVTEDRYGVIADNLAKLIPEGIIMFEGKESTIPGPIDVSVNPTEALMTPG